MNGSLACWGRDRQVYPVDVFAADGGDEEIRTPDFLLAKEALYQLSYVPVQSAEPLQWAFLDSNQRPLPYQGSALTT